MNLMFMQQLINPKNDQLVTWPRFYLTTQTVRQKGGQVTS